VTPGVRFGGLAAISDRIADGVMVVQLLVISIHTRSFRTTGIHIDVK
jgi:hypothetical protein